MLGNLLAGTDESPGKPLFFREEVIRCTEVWVPGAMVEGSSDRYFQEDAAKLVPEGIEGRVPYKGYVSETIFQLVGGLGQVWVTVG